MTNRIYKDKNKEEDIGFLHKSLMFVTAMMIVFVPIMLVFAWSV